MQELIVHPEIFDLYESPISMILDIWWIVMIVVLLVKELYEIQLLQKFYTAICVCSEESRQKEFWM